METTSPRQPQGHRGEGFGIFHFCVSMLAFSGDFPDRHKITVETVENGGNGRNSPENGGALAKSSEFFLKSREVRALHAEILQNRAETQ